MKANTIGSFAVVIAMTLSISSASALAAANTHHITLSVGMWPTKTNPQQYSLYQQYVTDFEKKYPNVTIKPNDLTWWSNGGAPFYAAAAAGQLPNFNTVPFTEPQKMIGSGYAINIKPELQKSGWLKYLNPAFLKLVTRNGKIYGVPNGAYTMGVLVNVGLFKKAGLVTKKGIPEVPKTWAQLAKDAVIIKQKTGAAGFFLPTTDNQGGWQFLNIAWGYGATFEKKVKGKWMATFDSPAAVKALQYVKDLKWKYNVLPSNILQTVTYAQQLFGTNQLAMYLGTPGYQNSSIQLYHMPINDSGEGQMPGGPVARVTQMGGSIVMFSPHTTPAQVMAGIHWLEQTGFSPFANSQTLSGFTENLVSEKKQGLSIGPQNATVFTKNAPVVKAENRINAKYTNVTMAYWNNYLAHDTQDFRPEPPVDAQQLYQVLDGVIQSVLTNKSANPRALLTKAVHDFQTSYLNQVNK